MLANADRRCLKPLARAVASQRLPATPALLQPLLQPTPRTAIGPTSVRSRVTGQTSSGAPTRPCSTRGRDGWCWFFGAIDHCVKDVVGWHVAKVGDRWAALEPIRLGVRG